MNDLHAYIDIAAGTQIRKSGRYTPDEAPAVRIGDSLTLYIVDRDAAERLIEAIRESVAAEVPA